MKKNQHYYLGENPTVDLIVVNPKQEILMIRRSSKSNVPADFVSENNSGHYLNEILKRKCTDR